MSRWFRCYDDVINDPKILRLPEATRWQWIAVLCVASKHDGKLPPISDIALMLRKTEAATATLLKTLVGAGLIDETETGFTPHNWSGRQFKSDVSNERVKRFRQRKCNVTSPVTVTSPDTDTDTEQKKDAPTDADASHSGGPSSTPESRYFERCKEVLGPTGGSLGAKLLKSKDRNVALAMSALELASTKHEPREYLGAIIRGRDSPEDLRMRGDAW